ncbi:heterokaryon incompatibility protein-domain-containing protein [Sordaria brevicollis]|uniref:Heterokaryon incompatibility protein-domain-containing protein n=1 Tax=Sordaria brevicollis TaxID=83679 RepID=A0AAE0UEW3_SORBR|nr:heterokaryon incompatibility protein-domain-containing protein [Sordaria brevicollis]
MRLIDTETLELHDFFELQAPAYAILSHTWEKDEITFQEMVTKSPSTMAKAGYKKIHNTCRLAQSRGQKWAWVDTCCIDKSSSAELTESINSMYRWYQKSEECYAYLVDFTPGSLPETELEQCRWFTRGFTLQELIAPKTVILFDREWNVVGEKKNERILHTISRITRISRDVLLLEKPPRDFAIAERMVWASTRKTTRPEDTAYCLLGIFEVHMPLIYGEGDNAFRRLQEEIIKRSTDLSIFAWGTPLNFQTEADKENMGIH